MTDDQRSGCPINLTLEVVGDKWSLLIIRDMMFGDRRHFVRLARFGILRVWRMKLHDALILLAPALLHLLQLRLANHALDAGSEMPRHSPDAADPIAEGLKRLRQLLRTDEDQCEDGDDRQL